MNSYFFIAKENGEFDHIQCIQDFGCCYWWKRSIKNMEVGDIVYLFISDKIHDRVMYRMKVVDIHSTRDDEKYWKKFKPDSDCFKFQNISPVYTGKHLNRQELEEHGISRHVQRPKRLSQEQADWLEKYF